MLIATAALVIVLVAISFGLVYQQIEIQSLKSPHATPSPEQTTPTPTVTPTPTPSPTAKPTESSSPTTTPTPTLSPTASPTATQLPSGVAAVFHTTAGGGWLEINGTVTNNSPNTAYNVGLEVFADGYPFIIGNPNKWTLINMTVPITSATYYANAPSNNPTLSTLAPYQTIPVNITIHSNYPSETPTLYDVTVTLVSSNT